MTGSRGLSEKLDGIFFQLGRLFSRIEEVATRVEARFSRIEARLDEHCRTASDDSSSNKRSDFSNDRGGFSPPSFGTDPSSYGAKEQNNAPPHTSWNNTPYRRDNDTSARPGEEEILPNDRGGFSLPSFGTDPSSYGAKEQNNNNVPLPLPWHNAPGQGETFAIQLVGMSSVPSSPMLTDVTLY